MKLMPKPLTPKNITHVNKRQKLPGGNASIRVSKTPGVHEALCTCYIKKHNNVG